MGKKRDINKALLKNYQEGYNGIEKAWTSGGGPVTRRPCLGCGDGVLDSNTVEYELGMGRSGFYHPYNRVAARHPGRVCNVGFVDSHVESQFINDMLYDRVLWGVELVGMPDKEPP